LKTGFVLVDFENVQPKDLALLNGGAYKIKVFLGTQQTKIPLALANALQAFGEHAQYIQINGNGNNAVDFHIAYYIGRLAAMAPDGQFHVISKDTGFDPLLKHLKEVGISCQRSESIAAIAQAKESTASDSDRLKVVIENLAKRKSARPQKPTTLRTTIRALFANKLSEDELDRLIDQLKTRGLIKISEGKVQYQLP
jgi:hypothetical protein